MKKYLIVLFSIIILFSAGSCLAQFKDTADMKKRTESFASEAQYADATEKSLPTSIANIIQAFLGVLGVIFIILIISAGWGWFTAGGAPDKAKKAKELLINSTIGLIIIFSAYSITYFVFKTADSTGGINGGGGGANTTTVP